MTIDRYDPVDLFEMIPDLRLEMDPELDELDRLLDDESLFGRVRTDLAARCPNSRKRGRPSTPVEVILRMLVVKRLYDFSYRQTERFVSGSIVLRQFCRLYLEPAPDDTTLIRWANVIGADTLEALNARVVELAKILKITSGRKLRTDGTVVETNIHYPTDGSLLRDGVRVLGRLARRAKTLVGPEIREQAPGELFRDRSRSANRRAKKIDRLAARSRSLTAKNAHRRAYGELLEIARKSVGQAKRLAAMFAGITEGCEDEVTVLSDDIQHFGDLLSRVISQTERRVFRGESMPAAEKLVSIFEPHTAIICRGKSGEPTEFGREIWLSEVEGGIVSSYRILDGNPDDAQQIKPELDRHLRLFGSPPRLLTADRGCYSSDNEFLAKKNGVHRACLPQKGAKTEKRREYESERWFKRAQRFRAGSEGRISVLKRNGHLGRCRDHAEEGFQRWVGWGVLAANLSTIAGHLAKRSQSGQQVPDAA
jgi:IS5 family transposase